MNASELRSVLDEALGGLAGYREELRALDAAIGDGDLGITVAGGAVAVRDALACEASDSVADVLRTAARSFAQANPSTMSGLVATGLLAAAREVGAQTTIDRDLAERLVTSAEKAIQARGGAELGDKTVLDALDASRLALQAAPADARAALSAMSDAAETAIADTARGQSQRGRAAWVGARSIGHADGGATAYLRFLQCLLVAWPSESDVPADV